jgi:hypothetical protein
MFAAVLGKNSQESHLLRGTMQMFIFSLQHSGVNLQESGSTLSALELIPFAEHFIQPPPPPKKTR